MSAFTTATGNRFLGRTSDVPRPSSTNWSGPDLEGAQKAWDAARDHAEENARLRDARLAKLDADRAAARDRAAAEADARASAEQDQRERELSAVFPGTGAQWAEERAAILAEDRRARTIAAATRSPLPAGVGF